MTAETITSTQNPRIKHLLQLQQKSSLRKKEGVFLVEGQREIMHCVHSGFRLTQVFYCPEILFPNTAIQSLDPNRVSVDGETFSLGTTNIVPVALHVYDKLAYRGGTEGMLAVVENRTLALNDLPLQSAKTAPLLMILEMVEKPGNLGAILRSADAAGVDAVIVCDPLTDIYNPNLIRSSLGAIFSVPCVACTSEECIDFLKRNNIQILTAQLQDSHLYYDTDMCKPTAIVMGTEATGLTQKWRDAADAHIRIPMLGQLDSLNVSVSAAILMFEAIRQRA